ncbi:MAG: arylamine N-acetyltransferase [Alphaproteobacteria bacterium]
MRLADYFRRIGYDGGVEPDLETLTGVHRAHLLAVPYENIDVALRRPVTRDPAAAFDKIVTRGRGGWCYEMNGLLGWALEEIGFPSRAWPGGVGRATFGDESVGNHLVLRVDLDRPYIADVGFGDGFLSPSRWRKASTRSAGSPSGWKNSMRIGGGCTIISTARRRPSILSMSPATLPARTLVP